MISDLGHSPCLYPLARTQKEARSVRSAHTAGAGAFLTLKDEDMSTTPSLTPHEKNARRYVTTLAVITTFGPFFYGFESMVLKGAMKAVGSTRASTTNRHCND